MSTVTARPIAMPRAFAIGLLVVCLGLGACGRRGNLEPPPDAAAEDVRLPVEEPRPPEEGQSPSRPFILDGLLQ